MAGARGLIRPQTIVSTYETHSGTGCAAEYWFIAANSEYCFHVLSGLWGSEPAGDVAMWECDRLILHCANVLSAELTAY